MIFSSDFKNGRVTIGFLTSGIGNPVSSNLWLGVADAAREHDVNLLCFVGEALQSPHGFKALANAVYDLASAENVAGLLFWNSALNNYVQSDVFERFKAQFQPLPMVDIEESAAVLTESYSYRGMRAAVRHLLETHARRRIAFIRGPEGNCEAEYRYHAYCDVLKEFQIPFAPELVTPPGRWGEDWAREAIRILLDIRHVTFDGLAAPSDLLAVRAMNVLQENGFRIPQEIAVVGIDDTIEGRCAAPPLTTAPYSLYTIGQRGVKRLLANIACRDCAGQEDLPIELTIRQSCGCLASSVVQAAVEIAAANNEALTTVFAAQREALLAEITQNLHESPAAAAWSSQIVDAFAREIMGQAPGSFLNALHDVLRQTALSNIEISVWQDVVSALRRHFLPYWSERSDVVRVENLWQQARIVIGEAMHRAQVAQRLHDADQARILRALSARLISTFDIKKLMDILAEELPQLQITSCYLSLYEHQEALTESARLMLAYHDQRRITLPSEGEPFPARQLIPSELFPQNSRVNMVIMPLYFEHHLGFVLFDMGPRDGSVYGVLSGQISSALQGALLVQSVNTHAAEIAKYRDGLEVLVEERTAALERTNKLLHQEITEHARAEQALRDSEQQYRLLAENVKEGLLIIQDGQLRFANHAFVALSGREVSELLQTDPLLLFAPAARETLRQRLQIEHLFPGLPAWETELLSTSGDVLWVEMEMADIIWNSQPARLLTLRNQTERKRREQQMEEARLRLEQENLSLKSSIKERYRFGALVGKSSAMQRVYELIVSAALSGVNVLIYGESGTGKELIAHTLHDISTRRAQKFVPVNCASVPESLFEREFFGHRKGAFTGADRDKPGLFDLAHRGTLFLDEVTELTPGMQAKLLRVLQDGEYLPLGSPVARQADTVIIAATNKDCQTEIEHGRLRKDFFYRIGIIEINIPPLRERKEDLPLLIGHLLEQYYQKHPLPPDRKKAGAALDAAALPAELMQALYAYDWPGNVRELQNILQRYLATNDVMAVLERIPTADTRRSLTTLPLLPAHLPLTDALRLLEKQKIAETLASTCYNTRKTAELLGMPLTTLYHKIKTYQLKDA